VTTFVENLGMLRNLIADCQENLKKFIGSDGNGDKPVGDWFARCLTICDIGVSLHLFAYVDISK